MFPDHSAGGPISNSTIERYRHWMPTLSRLDIFDAILAVGPDKMAIDTELRRRAAERADRPAAEAPLPGRAAGTMLL
jgi:hypothetical protein